MTITPFLFRRMFAAANIPLILVALLALCGPGCSDRTHKPAALSDEARQAWKEVEQALIAPAPPAEWQIKEPPPEEVEKFNLERARLAGSAADKAKEFFTRFPNDAKAAEARQNYHQLLQFAVQNGNTNKAAELVGWEEDRLKDPKLSDDERVGIRIQRIDRAAAARSAEGRDAVLAEYEKGARELQMDFPKRDEVYQLFLMVARNSDMKKARALATEVVAGTETAQLKEEAQGMLKKLDLVGKPLDLKFTAVDSREVDLNQLAGKVVLVDFWATWCGPCVAELPKLKTAYGRLHPKGFEVVGINFDEDKDKLQKFVAKEEMKWPQYFDGKGWENSFGQQFDIHGIPSMWLVDKRGNLRDINAQVDLEQKVEKLLAE